MKKLMCAVAQGARGVMRVYTRACCEKSRNKDRAKNYIATERELELRQLTMAGFLTNEDNDTETIRTNKKKEKKKILQIELCRPPDGALVERGEGNYGLVRWER